VNEIPALPPKIDLEPKEMQKKQYHAYQYILVFNLFNEVAVLVALRLDNRRP
jgi:hypothetical protein